MSQQLVELPLPKTWDTKHFVLRGDVDEHNFDRALVYVQSKAKVLGQGASRLVFKLRYKNRSVALKLPLDDEGVESMVAEAEVLTTPQVVHSRLFIPLIDRDTANGPEFVAWIMTEYARPITMRQFVEYAGCDVEDFVAYAEAGMFPLDTSRFSESHPMLRAARTLAKRRSGIFDDCDHISNWGWYDGRPVVIDAGSAFAFG